MPKPTLDDVYAIRDPMLNDNFDFSIANIPGGLDSRKFTVQCKTAVKPGMTIDQVEFALFGHKVRHAAKKTFSGTFSVEIYDDSKGTIGSGIMRWAEIIRGTDTQHGSFKRDYARNALLTAYDQTGAVAVVWEIENVWPTDIPEDNFDGEGGTAISHQYTFAFDVYRQKR